MTCTGQQRVVTTAQAMCASGPGARGSDIVIAVGNRVSASVNTQLLLASITLSRHKAERYISRSKALEPQTLRDHKTLSSSGTVFNRTPKYPSNDGSTVTPADTTDTESIGISVEQDRMRRDTANAKANPANSLSPPQ
ncbi:hypothetical protein CORC01_04631 [Colletotrichum orchidophilum]|uniref:Uncharacterized protein n=1 Tax=Colletotrichum orchidophilum TaxID=1209926 RepID=A0A1G4BEW0_9PEZI|nr:uncharacterized protein CORC01_04631 [Colletotrichum orchidophilum]OHE99984.1 hypothetical protein CORC01_04631 [Colletotrichum orchidophilum]